VYLFASSYDSCVAETLSIVARCRGCLLGGAVGDALGAPVEFMDIAQIRRRFGQGGIRDLAPAYGRVGAITDDMQMTLFTAGEGYVLAGCDRWLAYRRSGIVVPKGTRKHMFVCAASC
jgi:hypothetical protein